MHYLAGDLEITPLSENSLQIMHYTMNAVVDNLKSNN